jgi:phosphoglycerate dehydrogenase-like enzyme
MKVLFTYDYGKEKMNKIRDLGYEVIYQDEKNISNNLENQDIDVLACYNPFENLDISKMKRLKLIQLSSIGIDQIPNKYVENSDIVLCNNKGGYSIPIGEWIVMNILQIYKNTTNLYNNQKNKKWKVDTSVLEVYGKHVGFIGTGTLASEGAKRLQGFEAKIYGVNTNGRDTKYFDKCFPMKELDEVLKICDVIVITIPSTETTKYLINDEKLKLMKNGSVLINVARGNILNEIDLINNISRFRGVALDVFEEEPLSQNSPLWNFDNVIITPHNSWISEVRNERRFNLIYENLRRYINNEELINVVNLNKGY